MHDRTRRHLFVEGEAHRKSKTTHWHLEKNYIFLRVWRPLKGPKEVTGTVKSLLRGALTKNM